MLSNVVQQNQSIAFFPHQLLRSGCAIKIANHLLSEAIRIKKFIAVFTVNLIQNIFLAGKFKLFALCAIAIYRNDHILFLQMKFSLKFIRLMNNHAAQQSIDGQKMEFENSSRCGLWFYSTRINTLEVDQLKKGPSYYVQCTHSTCHLHIFVPFFR